MKNLWNKNQFILILLLIFSTFSCNFNSGFYPKFSISVPSYKAGAHDNACILGGVFFDFYNKAGVEVSSIEVRMNVYDKKNNQPAFPGIGTITAKIKQPVSGFQKKSFCISLDEYITVASDLMVDHFYVSRVNYKDGSEWKDYFGFYSQSEE